MFATSRASLRLTALVFIAAAVAMLPSYGSFGQDAWSAAARLERELLRVHPWDPDSFAHPEQYNESGRKITGGRSKPHTSSPAVPMSDSEQQAPSIPDDGTGRPPELK